MSKKEIIIYSPFNGEVIELKDVNDPVFSGEMVGKGFAVRPNKSEEEVFSPTEKGKIKMLFDGGHAYGIELPSGVELLIHIGIDTVTLKGKGFNTKTKVGKKVKLNSVLTEFDIEEILDNAPSADTMVLVTNETLGDYKIERIADKEVKVGEPLFKLV